MATITRTTLMMKKPIFVWYKCPKCQKYGIICKNLHSEASYDDSHAGWGYGKKVRLMEREWRAEGRIKDKMQDTISSVIKDTKDRDYSILEFSFKCPKCKYRLPWQREKFRLLDFLEQFGKIFAIIFGLFFVYLFAFNAPYYFVFLAGLLSILLIIIRIICPKRKKTLQRKRNEECLQLGEEYLPHIFLSKSELFSDMKNRGIVVHDWNYFLLTAKDTEALLTVKDVMNNIHEKASVT